MRRAWLTVGVVALASIMLEFLYRHHIHAAFWWHSLPAFDLLYGGVGAIILAMVAKWLGHTWLERPEDYYGDEAS